MTSALRGLRHKEPIMDDTAPRKLSQPIGWARKQDLLEYSPAWMTYAMKPAPENGYEPVALYSRDQVEELLQKMQPLGDTNG